MKYCKKKDTRLELRLSAEDKLLLEYVAMLYGGKTSSSYVRMLIDSAILPIKDKIQRGILNYENIQTFLDNQLQLKGVFRK